MAQTTTIEWTDVSWNPVHGCSKISTGCKNCYAETLSLRYGHTTLPWTALNAGQNVLLKAHKLKEPLGRSAPWDKPCRVFVNSMSDLFHEEIPDEYIAEVFAIMARAQRHTFQILTKRPERMRQLVPILPGLMDRSTQPEDLLPVCEERGTWPLPNVWLGVSIENRKWVGRADVLRDTPAAVRFISAEPLLGPLTDCRCGHAAIDHGSRSGLCGGEGCQCEGAHGHLDLFSIDWLIVGGESGSGYRPLDLQWARGLRDACACHGTAYFMKQTGGARPGTKLEDLPEDLGIREMPTTS